MPVDAVTAAGGTAMYSSQPARAPKQSMDSEVFMNLLVTQLTHQDPSSPMDTNAMISQTTELAMMEKITALTETGQESFSLQMRAAAADLIGRTVSYTNPDGTETTGTATSVSYAAGVPVVMIGDAKVSLDAVSSVTA